MQEALFIFRLETFSSSLNKYIINNKCILDSHPIFNRLRIVPIWTLEIINLDKFLSNFSYNCNFFPSFVVRITPTTNFKWMKQNERMLMSSQ